MSSYVFQFFCGPEGIALANPGAARARPALAGPPQRPAAELVFAHPGRPPAARLRSASASAEPDRPRRARQSASGHRRRRRQDRQDRHDRDRRHRRHHHHHHRRPRSRTPRREPRRPAASPPDRPPGQWQAPAQRPQMPTPTVPRALFRHLLATPLHQTWRMPFPQPRGPPPRQPETPQRPPRPGPPVQQQGHRGSERPRTPPKRAPARPPRLPLRSEPPPRHQLANLSPQLQRRQPRSWPKASSR